MGIGNKHHQFTKSYRLVAFKYDDIIRLKYLTKGVFNLGKAQKPRLAIANQGFLQRSIG